MADDLIIKQVRQSIERRRARPSDERWDELVHRGAIDAEGRVLLTAAAPIPRPKPKPKARKVK